MSHALGRGALLGLASVLCAAALADDALREWVQREYRGESYMLIEKPGEEPRLLLFDRGDNALIQEAFPADARRARIAAAVVALANGDAEVRIEAVLALADEDGADVAHLIAGALNDPSPDVREAAEAALEDLAD